MDPNACYDLLVAALAAGDEYETACARDDLREWLDGGGFWPTIASRGDVESALAQAVDAVA